MSEILFYLGAVMIIIGGICDLFGAIGLLRFPNFYVRLHAATVGTIGGAVVPLFGVALLALGADFLPHRYAIAGASFITGIIVLLAAPAGATALAYAAHKARLVEWKPKVDHLAEVRGDD
ncbi:Na+/H+ antiporter MnhG subunit [Thermococcus onnurineus NA1]|uniref:Na+/H+ antiporter MnhG subunit n=1 Tax=Thermococcus onnurineus (strain NA1) TaxID=523850 RepID=B6YTX4_THEON|nr:MULTISPECIES: monovalent cation/H(+) antiporter subunit G [Thermococcus]ACJ17065.1 Na+/H+ antiporter MnhG subunit [Thermococcus onnurineus NA1]NJE46604.1 cation:proton antiporter [Thermococcus sp. GR7]NJE77968.1 cation:proton antiporter [Thermococcus sp. GR4]NJF23096.1 cation:proton antiporter [Thermococcus sp. GR5]